jgi:hypothetical protein
VGWNQSEPVPLQIGFNPITNESQMLPAPMINTPPTAINRAFPTMRERLSVAGTTPNYQGHNPLPESRQLPAPGIPNQFQMPQYNGPIAGKNSLPTGQTNSVPLSMATPTMRQRLSAIGQFQGNDDVIDWANSGGHVNGNKKGSTIGNMFNGNLGSGVNIGMPMTTRAGLGGAYGYIASDPNASPQEKMRNALIGAAGGAFMPTIGRMIGRKAEGVSGVLMAPPGIKPMDVYHDVDAAQQANKMGLNYKGSLNKSTDIPALAKEQHYMNDDLGTKSSFVVHEGEDVADALTAHRKRYWGDKYEQKMKALNLKVPLSKQETRKQAYDIINEAGKKNPFYSDKK